MDIHVKSIVRAFEHTPTTQRPALDGVSLDIQSGELIALLGPSGSGKTTLLRIIAGLDIADSGSVFFGSEDAAQKTVQERKVGFVFQNYALFRHMNVGQNIAFGLNIRQRSDRPSRQEIHKRVGDLLDLVQLPGLENRFPAQLSGGQRQRVALARALAVEPKVLLLDEPFGALDAKVRRELRRWLREIHARTGHTTIFVTHDQDEALELADRVAVLNKGRIEQVGTPDEIYDQPASPFIIGFIGESGLIRVTVREGKVWAGDTALWIPVNGLADGPAQLFVRPQDAELGSSDKGAILAQVVAVRRTGATRRVELKPAGASGTLEIDAPAAMLFRTGDIIPIHVRKGHLFRED